MRDARPHCAKAGTVNSTFAPFTMSAAYFSESETTTPTRRFRNLRRFCHLLQNITAPFVALLQ